MSHERVGLCLARGPVCLAVILHRDSFDPSKIIDGKAEQNVVFGAFTIQLQKVTLLDGVRVEDVLQRDGLHDLVVVTILRAIVYDAVEPALLYGFADAARRQLNLPHSDN
ncbi:MAG TPA: hypothetical protein VEL51_15020 [Vicinamibacterales bacterium]|nr:hypothetical protein [Vicinamibacterales bacterium]